jgi:hypothetical protein
MRTRLSSTAAATKTGSPGCRGSLGNRSASASAGVRYAAAGSGVLRMNAERSNRRVTCTRRMVYSRLVASGCANIKLALSTNARALSAAAKSLVERNQSAIANAPSLGRIARWIQKWRIQQRRRTDEMDREDGQSA